MAPQHDPHLRTIGTLRTSLLGVIRQCGPLTVADYIELALYHPEYGYYATAPRRSGRDGDFYTSVDAGPLFGEMIAVQVEEMWRLLGDEAARRMDLVEAGAGDGRLTRDILDAAQRRHPDLYAHLRVTLVERSAAACCCHADRLRDYHTHYAGSRVDLPAGITGVIVANELLDAMPVHVVVGSDAGLREIYVAERDGALSEVVGPLSAAVAEYVRNEPIALQPGVRVEIGLRAIEWIAEAARALARGFVLLFDYGLPAPELYSNAHATGTLTTYRRHTVGAQSWLADPGSADITAHVDLGAIVRAASRAGLSPAGMTDQTYFLLALGITERVPGQIDAAAMTARMSAKTLLMPGALGSTIKVLAFAKGIGRPQLRGFSSARVT